MKQAVFVGSQHPITGSLQMHAEFPGVRAGEEGATSKDAFGSDSVPDKPKHFTSGPGLVPLTALSPQKIARVYVSRDFLS